MSEEKKERTEEPAKEKDGSGDAEKQEEEGEKKELKDKVKEAVGGEGRMELPDAALKALVEDSVQDLVDRGVLMKDPGTDSYDLREEVLKKEKKDKDGKEEEEEEAEKENEQEGEKADGTD